MTEYSPLFPYFGGKSTIAGQVWQLLGNPKNYIEPFFGSGAVLFMRPDLASNRIETVNDKDGMLANFWRAVQPKADPEAVAEFADWPVNENDLHARHKWLVGERDALTERLEADKDYYDAKIAGYWVWGISCWIGGGWCESLSRQIPHLGHSGRGIHKQALSRRRPHLSDVGVGHGINKGSIARTDSGLITAIKKFSDRLRNVRVCSGDWSRVCGDSVTIRHGLTGVFLDPPYSAKDRAACYAVEDFEVAHAVRDWCLERGDDPLYRIVLCGYESEHAVMESHGWRVIAWKAGGGYANQGQRRGVNATRERLFVSPHCLGLRQSDLFSVD